MATQVKNSTLLQEESPETRPESPPAADIKDWLVSRLAKLLEMDRDEIDVNTQVGKYGLSSAETVFLIADLEEWLGRPLDVTLVWDYPTIASLADYLANEERV